MKSKGVLLILVTLVSIFGAAACAGQAPLHPKAVDLNRAGVEALESGDLATAEARFALALEFHPRFVDAMVNLGLTEMQRGNFKVARQKLEKAVSINRNLAQPHHGLGVLCEREGLHAKATEHYRAALEVDPGFVASRANLARLYFDSGRLDYAREQFLRLLEAAPDAPQGYAGLIETLHRLGRIEQADQVLARAMERVGDSPAIRLYKARSVLRQGRNDEAESLLGSLTSEGGPLAGAAWGWLGLSRLVRGDVPGAISGAEHALSIDRDDALGTYVLAMALSARGDRDARAWLERAEKLAPGNPALRLELSRAGALP
jgi:tetratricopeptide (TPR) repeat protein